MKKLTVFTSLVLLTAAANSFGLAPVFKEANELATMHPAHNRKTWVHSPISLKSEDRNGDYLDKVPEPPKEASLNEIFFDKEISGEMSAKYKAFTESYEMKKAYRLDRMEDYLRYEQSNKDLVEWTMKKMLQYHTENSVKKAPEHSPAARAVKSTVRTVQAVQNSSMNLGQDTKVKLKTDIPHARMNLGMTSPIVDSNVEYRARAQGAVVGATNDPEKLTVGMSKSLGAIGASTGVRYGLIHQTVSYGATKHIAGPLSAQVDQSHYITDSSKDETIYRLNFGVSF